MEDSPLVHRTDLRVRRDFVDPRDEAHLYYQVKSMDRVHAGYQSLIPVSFDRADHKDILMGPANLPPTESSTTFYQSKLAKYPLPMVLDKINVIKVTANPRGELPSAEDLAKVREFIRSVIVKKGYVFASIAVYETYLRAKYREPLDQTQQIYLEDHPYEGLQDPLAYVGPHTVIVIGWNQKGWITIDPSVMDKRVVVMPYVNHYEQRCGLEMLTYHFMGGLASQKLNHYNHNISGGALVNSVPFAYDVTGFFLLD